MFWDPKSPLQYFTKWNGSSPAAQMAPQIPAKGMNQFKNSKRMSIPKMPKSFYEAI